jgi:hypothetical protein
LCSYVQACKEERRALAKAWERWSKWLALQAKINATKAKSSFMTGVSESIMSIY